MTLTFSNEDAMFSCPMSALGPVTLNKSGGKIGVVGGNSHQCMCMYACVCEYERVIVNELGSRPRESRPAPPKRANASTHTRECVAPPFCLIGTHLPHLPHPFILPPPPISYSLK